MGGWAKFFLGVGIAFGFLLVLGVVVAFAAVETATPFVEREYPTQLLSDSQSCATPCNQVSLTRSFTPPAGARVVEGRLTLSMVAAGGVVRVQVADPSGDIVFDRTVTGAATAQSVDDGGAWSPEEGDWTYTVSTTAFQGQLTFDTWSRGVPPGSLD